MSQILNLELSNGAFAAIRQRAEAVGTSPEDLVKALLENHYQSTTLPKETEQKAQVRFENHFGEVDFGYPVGADNDGIDKDLARAYAETNETS